MVGHRPITRSLARQGFPLEAETPRSRIHSTKSIPTGFSLSERFVVVLFFVVVFSVLHFVALVGIVWYLPGVELIGWILVIFRGLVFYFDDYEPLFDAVFALRFEQPLVIVGCYTLTSHIVMLATVFVLFAVAFFVRKVL